MTTGWLESVAKRAKVPIEETNEILQHYGIVPDRQLTPARNLVVKRIKFTGEKSGKSSEKIDFDWNDLKPGIWALATDAENLAGKSTVLEILLWCLRGEVKGLQDDVRSWLETVLVEFFLDDQGYSVEFDVVKGTPSGKILRVQPDGTIENIDKFSSDDAFKAAMSHFMMEVLNLGSIPSFRKDTGKSVFHDWLALSGGLYFGGDHKNLLGDQKFAGLPARTLQLYIGLPWAYTVMQAGTQDKKNKFDHTQTSKETNAAKGRSQTAILRLKKQLTDAKKALNGISEEQTTSKQLEQMGADILKQSAACSDLDRRLAKAENDFEQLQKLADDDKITLRNLGENIVATSFFNGLQPSCCPRCQVNVPKERVKQESKTLECSVCSKPIPADEMDGHSENIEEAKRRQVASEEALNKFHAGLLVLRTDRDKELKRYEATHINLNKLANSGAFQQRREVEIEVARIQGALDEHASFVHDALPTQADDDNHTTVVKAALKEANTAFDLKSKEILTQLNEEILRLANKFGITELEKVDLKATSGEMKLRKGGKETLFGKLTAGERLRIRIATAIALLRVGEKRGIGRHPGLLIIDSPGAEEMSNSNLSALLLELHSVVKETSNLQILIASANAEAVKKALDEKHCRIAEKGEYLW